MPTGWLVSLDDPRARDHEVVGVKSAWLARARARGLPVLPGVVVPVAAASHALSAGQDALESVGPGRARPAAMQVPLDANLARELDAIGPLGERLVVRSSSELDDDGAWAGAFASYGDVGPGEVGRAVRGCWASVFAPDALARFEREGRVPGQLRLGVLVQPHLRMDHGGWARVADGELDVAYVAGEPGPLMSGQVRGHRLRVPLRARRADRPPAAFLADLAAVAARAREELGADRLEWGVADGEVTILQLARSGDASTVSDGAPDEGRFRGPEHVALARVLATRRGPLASRLLTPWAAWHPTSRVDGAGDAGPLVDDVGQVLERADRLAQSVAASAGCSIADLRDMLASGRPLGHRPRLDPELAMTASTLLEEADALAVALAARGALPSAAAFWWQDETWLAGACAAVPGHAPRPSPRAVVDRWDDLRFGVARVHGQRYAGQAASVGRATGRARRLSGPVDAGTLERGDILIIEHPTPALAPLLWDCAGVVAASGSPGAHLCEVARSIHVPMVLGVEPPARPGAIVALDGETGEAWTWPP